MQPEVQGNLAQLQDFKSLWRQMDGTHKKLILQAMFDGLYFDHEHRLCKVAVHSPFDRLLGLTVDSQADRASVVADEM